MQGLIARVEELARIPSKTHGALSSVSSEKSLPIAELNEEAVWGFNLIAIANNHDRGVDKLPSALKRRFNTVAPPPSVAEEEVRIVQTRVSAIVCSFVIPAEPPGAHQNCRVAAVFRELREDVRRTARPR